MLKHSNKGFIGVMEIGLIVLIIAALGFVGWRVLGTDDSQLANQEGTFEFDGELMTLEDFALLNSLTLDEFDTDGDGTPECVEGINADDELEIECEDSLLDDDFDDDGDIDSEDIDDDNDGIEDETDDELDDVDEDLSDDTEEDVDDDSADANDDSTDDTADDSDDDGADDSVDSEIED